MLLGSLARMPWFWRLMDYLRRPTKNRPDLVEYYRSQIDSYSMESSSFHPGRIDGTSTRKKYFSTNSLDIFSAKIVYLGLMRTLEWSPPNPWRQRSIHEPTHERRPPIPWDDSIHIKTNFKHAQVKAQESQDTTFWSPWCHLLEAHFILHMGHILGDMGNNTSSILRGSMGPLLTHPTTPQPTCQVGCHITWHLGLHISN